MNQKCLFKQRTEKIDPSFSKKRKKLFNFLKIADNVVAILTRCFRTDDYFISYYIFSAETGEIGESCIHEKLSPKFETIELYSKIVSFRKK